MSTSEVKSKYDSVLLLCRNVEWARNLILKINEFQPGLCICFESNHSKKTSLDFVRKMNPDLVIMDVHLNEGEFDGLWLAKKLFNSNFLGKVAFKSDYQDSEIVCKALFALIGAPVETITCDSDSIIRYLF